MVDRREALKRLAAMGIAAAARKSMATNEEAYSEARYTSAIVIDALGGPGELDPTRAPGDPDAPLSTKALADVKASGITAVNVTVGEVGNGSNRFEKTVDAIAQTEREIALHPDVFVKVLRSNDLALAKASGRMGLIYGFQDTSMLRVGEEVALLAPHRSRRAELPQRVPQANLAGRAQACMIRGRRSGWRRRSCS